MSRTEVVCDCPVAMSHQAARAPVSPALSTTSYGQVIEYIQSKYQQSPMDSVLAHHYQRSCMQAETLQTESTSHRILILPMSTLHSHIQQHPSSHLRNARPSHHIAPHQYHQAPKCILPSTSQSTIIYSITASMQILDHCTLGISTVSLSSSTRSWETQITQKEGLCSGASQTRGAGQMPLVYWLVT